MIELNRIHKREGCKENDYLFLKTAKQDDMLFFYYSGHGIPDSIGDHFLAFSDIDIKIPDENGFRFADLEKMMRKSDARRIVAVLDCCLAGVMGARQRGMLTPNRMLTLPEEN